MQRKQQTEQKEVNRKGECIHNIKKLQVLEDDDKANIKVDLRKVTLKTYQIWKRQAIVIYIEPSFKNSWPSTKD